MKLRAAVAARILRRSSLALATAACAAMMALSSGAEPPRATAEDRAAAPAQPAKGPGDVQKRVRELLYVLRYYRVDVRNEEWAGAIRELVQFGGSAVPEI